MVEIEHLEFDATENDSKASVHAVLVKITCIEEKAGEMIETIQNVCWLQDLNPVAFASYKARAEKTIKKLVENILTKVTDELTADFGEFMVSDSAQKALEEQFSHIKVPLAELLKEKLSGNPGFDFHTQTHTKLVAFGEAKFSGSINPYKEALTQISDFIELEKDSAELIDLSHFVSSEAIEKALQNDKAYVAAFSINSDNPQKIITNAFNSEYMKALMQHNEIYLVGVCVNDK
ncbi:TPA: hypothetical protein ACVO32_004271 [Vibrio diabolicus]